MDSLADDVSVLLEQLTPTAFNNLTAFSATASKCRIGKRLDLLRPFSGVTGVVDFCAHLHRDRNDSLGGCTMVCIRLYFKIWPFTAKAKLPLKSNSI